MCFEIMLQTDPLHELKTQNVLFVCMFGVFVPLENFFSNMETPPLPTKGCKFYTYTRHLSSEGSLACQTYCDTGYPFIMVVSKDP